MAPRGGHIKVEEYDENGKLIKKKRTMSDIQVLKRIIGLVSAGGYKKYVIFLFSVMIFGAVLGYIRPLIFQDIINLNPVYYVFFLLRVVWVEDNIFLSIASYPFHLFILIIGAGIIPFIGVIIFNKIYRKYGIVGY